MQTIQLKTEEYQLSESTDNLFQLRPLASQSPYQVDLQYNFAPLICPKTEKIIRTLPSISQEKSNSTLFNTQIDVQFNIKSPSLNATNAFGTFKSMRNLGDIDKAILVPKPLSHYCQICKETFTDYQQHINHSSHQKKLKEGTITNKDFIEIEGILKKKSLYLEKKQKDFKVENKVSRGCLTFKQEEKLIKTKNESEEVGCDSQSNKMKNCETKLSHSSKFLELDDDQEKELCDGQKFGSKKRIIVNSSGVCESMTLISERLLSQQPKLARGASVKKFVSLRVILDHDEHQSQ